MATNHLYTQGVGEGVAVDDGAAGTDRRDRGEGEVVSVALAVAVGVEVLVEVMVEVGLAVTAGAVAVPEEPGVAIWIEMFSPLHAV